MDRRKVFYELVEHHGKPFRHHKGKQQVVANEWKNIKNAKNNNGFMNTVSSKKRKNGNIIK